MLDTNHYIIENGNNKIHLHYDKMIHMIKLFIVFARFTYLATNIRCIYSVLVA